MRPGDVFVQKPISAEERRNISAGCHGLIGLTKPAFGKIPSAIAIVTRSARMCQASWANVRSALNLTAADPVAPNENTGLLTVYRDSGGCSHLIFDLRENPSCGDTSTKRTPGAGHRRNERRRARGLARHAGGGHRRNRNSALPGACRSLRHHSANKIERVQNTYGPTLARQAAVRPGGRTCDNRRATLY